MIANGNRREDAAALDRLLNLLDITDRSVSFDVLSEILAGFMERVPFENISKLYYKIRYGLRGLPNLVTYIDGIERYHFGGTCYANNYCLNRILTHLHFDVTLCGADMTNPDVHVVNLVSLDGREFLVDAGYAAPFVKPLPRDLTHDHLVALGHERYILHPRDESGRSRLDLYRNGRLVHGYTVKPIPRKIDHFLPVIENSYRDEAEFMNSVLLARFHGNRSTVIRNLSIIESEGDHSDIERISSKDELPAAVYERFSIPPEIVSEAIAGLGDLSDARH